MATSMFIERARLIEMIGCCRTTIDRMVEAGELPKPVRLGRLGRHRFIRSEIEPALKKHGIDLGKLEAEIKLLRPNDSDK